MKTARSVSVSESSAHRIHGIVQYVTDALPTMTIDEQDLSLTLYRKLARGQPVSLENIGGHAETVRQRLSRWPGVFFDDDGRVTGYWGLTLQPTRHRVEIEGQALFTWCAWDALFIPQLLGHTARVTSSCAVTEQTIRLTVSPNRIDSVEPDQTVLSFVLPDPTAFRDNVTTSFCHFVHFFRSRTDGEHWVREHKNTFVLSLDDAFNVGQEINARRYPGAMSRNI